MREVWQPAVLAAVVILTMTAGIARGQTLEVTNAPQGATVELVLNNEAIGSAPADPAGFATIPIDIVSRLKKRETDVYIHVETCGAVRRVIMAERTHQPAPPAPDCDRRTMGLFLLRRVSTVVVNLGGVNPTVLLVQARFDPRNPRPIRPWNAAPTGLVLTAGGGLMKFADVRLVSCGELSDCEGGSFKGGYSLGVTHWMLRFLGVEAGFVKPAEAVVTGAGDGFRFTSTMGARVVTVAGKVGVPAGPARVYGKGGGTFSQAVFTTRQTHDDRTVTINNVSTTIPGGTQTLELNSEGWGWLIGGGMEIWVQRRLALYAEFDLLKLKGSPVDDADGELNDRITSIVLGARFHIGR